MLQIVPDGSIIDDMRHSLAEDRSPTAVPDLSDPRERARLTPAAVDALLRLSELWDLSVAEACALLGGISPRTWYRMKAGLWNETLGQDSLTRVSVLLGIFKGLRLLFSQPLSEEWVHMPNEGPLYRGRRPLDLFLAGGIPAMLETRRHIDALRGGL